MTELTYRGWKIKTKAMRDWVAIIYRPGSAVSEAGAYPAASNDEGEQVCVDRAEAEIDRIISEDK